MSRFHPVDRQTGYLLPPSVDDWLPEGHLARFIVEVVDELDISALEKAYLCSSLNPLPTTIRLAPTSANTAIHIVPGPIRVSISPSSAINLT